VLNRLTGDDTVGVVNEPDQVAKARPPAQIDRTSSAG
jgi:hypothetical protein